MNNSANQSSQDSEDDDMDSLDIPLKSLKISKYLSHDNITTPKDDENILIQYPDEFTSQTRSHPDVSEFNQNNPFSNDNTQKMATQYPSDLTNAVSNGSGHYKQILNNDVDAQLEIKNDHIESEQYSYHSNDHDLSFSGNRKEVDLSISQSPDNNELSFQYPDDINDSTLKSDHNISIDNNPELNPNDDSDSDSDSDNWETMPAVASYNVYNNKGELELKKYTDGDMQNSNNNAPENNAGPQNNLEHKNTFDYTKITAEQQAQRSYTSNKKTDFLFQHKKILKNLDGHANLSQQSLTKSSSTLSLHSSSQFYDEYEDDVEKTDDLNLDSQLNITNLLLSDMEKIAYAGAINILTNKMCTDLATLCLCVDIKANKKLASRLNFTQKDMAAWKLVVLQRLYAHLNINDDEIKMIENLSLHQIELTDILKSLKTTRDIENPWENSPYSHSSSESLEELPKESTNTSPKESANASPKESPELEIPKSSSDSVNLDKDGVKEVIDPEKIKDKTTLPIDVAWTIVCDLFLVLLQNSTYDARSRTLLVKFADALDITDLEVCEFEKRVTDSLDMEQSTDDQVWNESDHMKKRRAKKRRRKMAYVGLAMVGGSLVLGLSGGLLAPVIGAGIAAGLSTIGITGATGFLTGVGGTTAVALSSTAIGANIGARGMSKRMGSVRTFEFIPLYNNRRVNLIISVSGWIIGNEDDVRLPFSTVDPVEGDLYSLYWEPEMLKSTGQTINIVASEVFTQTIQQVLGATILTAFMSAIQWPMVLSKLGYIIDNPWNVSLDRAWSAGLILADTLITRNLGQRPVTLVGFSLGSRVIYSCLIELCKKKALGLVENVFIFGTPVVRKKEQLVMARSVVSGRFVNGYSAKDWVLAYLFRATAGGFSKVMGITPAEDVEGIEDFNCTELVDGHMAYRKNMPKLLKKLGIEVISEEFVEIEETMDPEQAKRQRKLVREVDAAQKKLAKKKEHNAGWMPKWMKPKKSKWKKMAEGAIEDQNIDDISFESVDTDESAKKKKPKDSAIVDHGALMGELEKLKKAIREDELKNQMAQQAESANSSKEPVASSNDILNPFTDDSEIHGDLPAIPKTPLLPSTPRIDNTPNSFQLLTAGRTILPEDDNMKRNTTHRVEVAFPDDI
ncbi:probable lipase Mil1p [Monosporozyma servazzii]